MEDINIYTKEINHFSFALYTTVLYYILLIFYRKWRKTYLITCSQSRVNSFKMRKVLLIGLKANFKELKENLNHKILNKIIGKKYVAIMFKASISIIK